MTSDKASKNSRKWWPFWIMGGAVVLALLVVGGYVAWIRLGPTGPVPTRDPRIAINEQAAALQENAADFYIAAMELAGPNQALIDDLNLWWDPRCDVPGRMYERLGHAAEHMDLLARGAAVETCIVPFDLDTDDIWGVIHGGRIRDLSWLLQTRARLAGERGDLHAAARDVITLKRLGMHLMRQVSYCDRLLGMSIVAMAQSVELQPLSNEQMPLASRAAYARTLLTCRYVRPDPNAMLQFERDRWVFTYASLMGGYTPRGMWEWLKTLPLPRYAGAYDQDYALVGDLWRASAQARLDPNSVEWNAIEQLTVSRWASLKYAELPTEEFRTNEFFASKVHGARFEARLDLWERGNTTALLLFLWRAECGDWPATLQELISPEAEAALGVDIDPNVIIDVHTGVPLIYRRIADDNFVLYSADADHDDDGGRQADINHEEGDFVFWPISVRMDPRPENGWD